MVDECYKIAEDYCAKARDNLETLPKSAAYESLVSLTDYILERDI